MQGSERMPPLGRKTLPCTSRLFPKLIAVLQDRHYLPGCLYPSHSPRYRAAAKTCLHPHAPFLLGTTPKTNTKLRCPMTCSLPPQRG